MNERPPNATNIPTTGRPAGLPRSLIVCLAGLITALLWSYWPLLADMVRRWAQDPQYSHGFLVPVFAATLLWLRRTQLEGVTPSLYGWGIPVLLLGAVLRLAASYTFFDWLGLFSFVVCLAGLAVLFIGRRGIRWAWPAIAFLVFMIPWPYRLEVALAHPLQRVAAAASTYALQTLGVAALAEGNTIVLDEVRLEVIDACSGLSMIASFLALATGVAMLVRRPLWEKVLIVLSSVPIAVIVNVLRITLTGVAHEVAGSQVADQLFHGPAGLLMPPVALALLWLELKFLSRALVQPGKTLAVPLGFPGTPSRQPVPRTTKGEVGVVGLANPPR